MTISLNHAKNEKARVAKMSDTWILQWDYLGNLNIGEPILFGGAAGTVILKATTDEELTSEIDFHLRDNWSAKASSMTVIDNGNLDNASRRGAMIGKAQMHPLTVYIDSGIYLVTADGPNHKVFETGCDNMLAAFMEAYRQAYCAD